MTDYRDRFMAGNRDGNDPDYTDDPDPITAPRIPLKGGTCAERLPDHLAGRLADFRVMLAREDPDEAPDDIDEPGPLNEYALGVSVIYSVRVELSTGGPADYLTADVDADGDIERIAYHYADWFDHAERYLDGDAFDTARDYIGATLDLSSLSEYIRG